MHPLIVFQQEQARLKREFIGAIPNIKNHAAAEHLATHIYLFHIRGRYLNQTDWSRELVNANLASLSTGRRLIGAFIAHGYLVADQDRLKPTEMFLRDFLALMGDLDRLLAERGFFSRHDVQPVNPYERSHDHGDEDRGTAGDGPAEKPGRPGLGAGER